MKDFNSISAVLIAISLSFFCIDATKAHAATLLVGDARFSGGGSDGERLYVAGGGGASADGQAYFTGGETVTLESGSDPNELPARPKLDVGEGYAGYVLISGDGTEFILNGTTTGSKFEVGNLPGGVGTVEVDDGALVVLRGGLSTNGDPNQGKNVYIQLGENGGEGNLIVTDSTFRAEGDANVNLTTGANSGSTGSLALEGATVALTTTGLLSEGDYLGLDIANGAGTVGTATISNSSLELTGLLTIGDIAVGSNGARGELNISNSSVLGLSALSAGMNIGGNGGIGEVTVTSGSLIDINGESNIYMNVGGAAGGFGRLVIEEDSIVNVQANGGGAIIIGEWSPEAGSNSVGILQINGALSNFQTSQDVIIGAGQGQGTDTTGLVSLDGGTLVAPNVTIGQGGIVSGNGTINANIDLQAGGLLGVGFSPGSIEIGGNLSLTGGLLEIEVAGLADGLFDYINVLGSVFATNPFELRFSFIDGFIPDVGDTFNFLDSDFVSDSFFDFGTITYSGLGAGSEFTIGSLNGAVGMRVDTVVSPVPIPASAIFLLMGVFGLGMYGKNRKAVSAV